MLERLALLDHPPIIGQQYLVPAALALFPERYRTLHPLLSQPHWWPYRGPPHNDPDFEAYEVHVHIEARFLSPGEYAAIKALHSVNADRDGAPAVDLEDAPYLTPVNLSFIRGYGVFPRVCARDDTARSRWTDASVSDLLAGDPRRENWHLGARRICPHQGYDLRTIAPDGDGCVTCPLHQLKYGADGKLMVTQHARESAQVKRGIRALAELLAAGNG